MYIFREFPEPGCESDWNTRSLRTGSCFDVLLHHQAAECPQAFSALATDGIVLGEGAYVLLLFETEQRWMAPDIFLDQPSPVLQEIFTVLQGPFTLHLFTNNGFLYGLIRMPPDQVLPDAEIHARLTAASHRLFERWGIRTLVSRTEVGQAGIFHAANSVYHALEFAHFMGNTEEIQFLDIHQQTRLGSTADTDDYQRLASLLCEQMDDTAFDQNAAAHRILQAVVSRTSYSIEALHTHMQTFSIILMQTLKSTMLVDTAFLEQLELTEWFMEGDRASLFEEHLAQTLQSLHRRRLEIRQQVDTAYLQRVRTYVEQNISSWNLSVSSVADQFHVNRSTLTRQFRTCFGVSLAGFIQNTRISRACLLLESHPQRNMEQIAMEAGYGSVSTMYRAFQRKGLESPAVYQKRMTWGNPSDPKAADVPGLLVRNK